MKTFIIDPGHGGKDPGAVLGDRLEKDDTLRMSVAVSKLLKASGHNVVLTRITDQYLDVTRRGALYQPKCDLYLSIHRDAFEKSSANGATMFYRQLAHATAMTALYAPIADLGVFLARGVKQGSYIVLDRAPSFAGLLELGFITNAQDNAAFDEHFDDIATAVARGMCAAVGTELKTEVPKSEVLYRVQTGAFKSRDNAEAYVDDLKAKGINSFIVEA